MSTVATEHFVTPLIARQDRGGVVPFAVILLLTTLAGILFSLREGLVIIVGAHAIVILVGIFMRARRFDIFELCNIFLGLQFVSFILLFLVVVSPEGEMLLKPVLRFDLQVIRYEVAFYTMISTVAYLFGYNMAGTRKNVPSAKVSYPTLVRATRLVPAMLASLAAFYIVMGVHLGGITNLLYGLYFVRGTGISYTLGIVQPLLSFGTLFIPYVLVFRFRCSAMRALLSPYSVGFVAVLGLAMAHNSRGAILTPIFVYLTALYYVGRLRLGAVMIGLGIVGIVILTISFSVAAYIDPSYAAEGESKIAVALGTFDAVSGFGMVISTYPDSVDYQYGQTFLEEAVYPVLPRIFFPDKPSIYGHDRLWALAGYDPLLGQSQFSISQPGEWYAQFGPIAIVVGLCLFGFLSRRAYDLFQRHRNSAVAVFAYGYFVVLYQGMHRGTFPYVYALAQESLVILALWYLARGSTIEVTLDGAAVNATRPVG